jgi:hypothetical protein
MKDITAATCSLPPSDLITKSTSSFCKRCAKIFGVHQPTQRVSRWLSSSTLCHRVPTLGGEMTAAGDHVTVSDLIGLRADYVESWSSRRIHRPGDNLQKPTYETGNDSPFHLLFNILYLYYFIDYESNWRLLFYFPTLHGWIMHANAPVLHAQQSTKLGVSWQVPTCCCTTSRRVLDVSSAWTAPRAASTQQRPQRLRPSRLRAS